VLPNAMFKLLSIVPHVNKIFFVGVLKFQKKIYVELII